jgi:hypothetical protein
VIRPPGKMMHGELEAGVATLKFHKNLEAGSHDLISDAVAGDDGDAVSSHCAPSSKRAEGSVSILETISIELRLQKKPQAIARFTRSSES